MEVFFSYKKRISLVSTAIAMNKLKLLSHLTFRMNDFTGCKWFICVYSSRQSAWTSTACSVASFGTFVSRALPYMAYRYTVFFVCFLQQFLNSFVCCSNERMKKCKSVNLFFFSMFMLLKSQTSAIKYVFSFIPNEVGSPMLFTVSY